MKYKLIASDFDDTLYDHNKGLSEKTLQTIKEYKERGGRFVIVTGRMFSSIIKQAKVLGLKGELIAYQGALICDIESEKVIKSFSIDNNLAADYVEFMLKQDILSVQSYVDDTLTVGSVNKYVKHYADYCNVTPQEVGDLVDFLRHTDKPIHKVYCASKKENTPKVFEAAKAAFGDKLLINCSQPINVEAVTIETSKGLALDYLCKEYGIDKSEVMAFGDQLNDLTLLDHAGFAVAVGNAADKLKEIADYVCEPCIEDGVAKTIEKYCF